MSALQVTASMNQTLLTKLGRLDSGSHVTRQRLVGTRKRQRSFVSQDHERDVSIGELTGIVRLP